MAVIDLRGKMMGGTDKRYKVTKIARHHSATEVGDAYSFQNFWRNVRRWKTGGYHEIVLPNGDVQLNYDWNVVTNGVYGHNQTTYHICVVGNGKFTAAQEKAFDERTKLAMQRFNLSANDVLGHREFSSQSTTCPGVDMNKVRARLKGAGTYTPDEKQTGSVSVKPTSSWTKVSGDWTGQTLRNGQYGNPVKQLQTKLKNKGYLTAKQVDSYFGNETESAVKKAQKDARITIDGFAGKNTYRALDVKSTLTASVNVDGKWGKDTTKALQRAFNTPVDGIISKQSRNSVTTSLYSNTVQFGTGGSVMVRALQRKLKVTADGLLGPATVRALQKHLGTPVDGVLSRPSMAVKELQRRLNTGTF